jgi:hypothetical protein
MGGELIMKMWRGLRTPIMALAAIGLVAVAGAALGTGEALAQRTIQIGGGKRTTVSVYIGKSEDVRTVLSS